MEFFSVNGTRPVRLSEETRQFAWDSQNHRYGLDTKKNPSVSLDHIVGFEQLPHLEQYDLAIAEIAAKAPIRICENERISGAATLGDAISHQIPARVGDMERGYLSSVSHLTIDFETVLKEGVNGIRRKAEASLLKFRGTDREPFLVSCLHCLDAMRVWHQRYLKELDAMPSFRANYENLLHVPFEPANSFYEAVQSLWFTFAFVRLCGNWPGIGRIDWLLGDYLRKDLDAGVLTIDEAREILAHFFIKGCEWICGGNYGSGDAQHYQNLVLSGVDACGNDVTNEVTYLVLDIIEELGISDFPTTVRISKRSDTKLLRRVAEVIRLGGGVLALYNEDLILKSLVDYGYAPDEAAKFANDGCWEIQIPGRTFFCYFPFDGLQVLQHVTLKDYEEGVSFSSFDALYRQYVADLRDWLEGFFRRMYGEIRKRAVCPCTVVSLFEDGCIEKGLSYNEGGPVYNVLSPHFGGLPDVVNSLSAIRKLVFEEHKVTFPEFMKILKGNWEGCEPLRRYALRSCICYGNDNEETDQIAVKLIRDFAEICDHLPDTGRYRTPAGISTFGRQLEWAPHRASTPFGKLAGEVLAGNFSPTPGTDLEGATAILKSYCKADLTRTVSGAALDLKLLPSAVNGERGTDVLIALMRAFVELGGCFVQPDIADADLLRRAQEHPEDYQNLSVRISGWNARFVTLNREWQDMIIAQTGTTL